MQHISAQSRTRWSWPYHMRRVVDLAMSPELGLDVLVAQHAHLRREVLAVGAQETTVERDRGQQGRRRRLEAVALNGCRGQSGEGPTHRDPVCGGGVRSCREDRGFYNM